MAPEADQAPPGATAAGPGKDLHSAPEEASLEDHLATVPVGPVDLAQVGAMEAVQLELAEDSAPEDPEDQVTALEDQAEDSALGDTVVALDSVQGDLEVLATVLED